jgi:hypothetical protein
MSNIYSRGALAAHTHDIWVLFESRKRRLQSRDLNPLQRCPSALETDPTDRRGRNAWTDMRAVSENLQLQKLCHTRRETAFASQR